MSALRPCGRSKGISLVAIDRSLPLTEQGPFDVLLHKVRGRSMIHPIMTVLLYETALGVDSVVSSVLQTF